MALNPVKIADIQQAQPITRDAQGHAAPWFITALNTAFRTLTNAINGINDAINAAAVADAKAETADGKAETAQSSADTAQATGEAAQTSADTAQTSADTAQARADDAYALADGKVDKNTTPAPSYSIYVAPTISNPPTQSEVQAIANALAAGSSALSSTINKLESAEVFS